MVVGEEGRDIFSERGQSEGGSWEIGVSVCCDRDICECGIPGLESGAGYVVWWKSGKVMGVYLMA